MDNNIEQYISPAINSAQAELSAMPDGQAQNLAGLLQTSLQVYEIIRYFIESVRKSIPFDFVDYSYQPLSIKIVNGTQQRHQCAYRLNVAGESLGKLVFSRRQRFSDQDMQHFEDFICQLVYPLRNAIWYQKALNTAHNDSLTGALNRYAYEQHIENEIDRVRRYGTELAMVIIDISNLRQINDQQGNHTGDEVLVQVVKNVTANLRRSDLFFRYSGKHFIALLPGCKPPGLQSCVDRLHQLLVNQPVNTSEFSLNLSVNFAAAICEATDNPARLLERVNNLLQQAKSSARQQVSSCPTEKLQGVSA